MNKWLLRTLYAAPVLLVAGLSWADYTATQGAGTTVFAFVCSATKVCPASVLINSANTEIATASNPVRIDPTGTTTQPVTNTNLGTTADAVCGTATGTCSLIALTKFNNTATSNPIPAGTNAIGTVTAVQATGTNLHVVCDSGCSGSGGTSSNFGSAFPAAGTAIGLTSGTNMVAWSATTNYGTAPAAIAVPAVNAFITNTNANGAAASSASSPVVLATDQTAADACMYRNKTNLAISQNGTASVQLIALSGSTVIYVCSLTLVAAGATTVAITTGTGTACVTGNAAVIGTTTASIANSMSLAANGGLTLGNGGGTVAKGVSGGELCMVLGTSVFVSGNLTYVQI